MRPWQRFTAIEYAKPASLHEEIARGTDLSPTRAQDLLLRAGDRVRAILGLESVPLALSGEKVQFQNVAGLLVLASGLELEIAPKFLGNVPGWREDFFLLATLSHHGRLLDGENLKSSAHTSSDLATLIGRSLIEMYWRNQRRPLRTYRRLQMQEFAIEGDFDPGGPIPSCRGGVSARSYIFHAPQPLQRRHPFRGSATCAHRARCRNARSAGAPCPASASPAKTFPFA